MLSHLSMFPLLGGLCCIAAGLSSLLSCVLFTWALQHIPCFSVSSITCMLAASGSFRLTGTIGAMLADVPSGLSLLSGIFLALVVS